MIPDGLEFPSRAAMVRYLHAKYPRMPQQDIAEIVAEKFGSCAKATVSESLTGNAHRKRHARYVKDQEFRETLRVKQRERWARYWAKLSPEKKAEIVSRNGATKVANRRRMQERLEQLLRLRDLRQEGKDHVGDHEDQDIARR